MKAGEFVVDLQLALYGVPAHLREGLTLYLEHHVHVGHFLTAVLSNDLREAVARGDDTSLAGLPAIVRYLVNCAPIGAWGSPATVADWLARRAEVEAVSE